MNKVSICACVIWVIGFALSFVMKPGSPLIWLPDFLLLAGFLPLLFSYKPAWPWFVFGVGNVLIGVVLEITRFVPEGTFSPAVLPVQEHLNQMHDPLVWVLFGFFSAVCGLIRLLKRIVIMLKSKKS